MRNFRAILDDKAAFSCRAALSAVLALALVTGPGTEAIAQQGRAERSDGAATPLAADANLTQGEVRKVDKEAMKLTIRHGPLRNLDMPAMTMVFRVKDPAMLDGIKAGDRIDFVADRIDGAYTVIQVDVRR